MKRMVAFTILFTFVIVLLSSCSGGSQGIGETGISAEEFDSLRLGMSKEKVNEIIGGIGEKISESKDEDDNYYTYVSLYRYEGETGGYAELEFTQKVTKDIYQAIGGHSGSLDVTLSAKTKYDLQ